MSLKELRHDLTNHLADGLGVSAPPLGSLPQPPAVVVQSGDPYLNAVDYCTDSILFAATIISSPGDPPAVMDALDDFIDRVRSTLRVKSANNNLFGFREIAGFSTYPSGDRDLPAVTITVGIDRIAPT